MTWQKENNQDKAVKLILFLISPLFSFIYSIKNIKTKSSFVYFFLFAVFFGLSFTVTTNRDLHSGFDSPSYRAGFEAYENKTADHYLSTLDEYLQFDEGRPDLYDQTIYFFVSRITGNYHVMFMVIAAIFAFFALKSFAFFVKDQAFIYSIPCFILAFLFMSNQIFNINNFRFWTAAWMSIYILFNVFVGKNKRFLILSVFLPFMHSAYWMFLVIMVVYFLSGRYTKFWSIAVIISFFISNITLELLNVVGDFIPDFLQSKFQGYTRDEYIDMFNRGGSGFIWVVRIFQFLIRAYLNLLVYLFIRNSKDVINNIKTKGLYQFLLVLITFVNLTIIIPEVGTRFMMLTIPIISYIWLVNFNVYNKYRKVLYFSIVVFSFKLLGLYVYTFPTFRHYDVVLEPYFYFSSPIYLIYRYLILIPV